MQRQSRVTKHSPAPLGNPFVQVLLASATKHLNAVVTLGARAALITDEHSSKFSGLAGDG